MLVLMVTAGLLSACQTEIEVDLPDYDSKLVVEGYIENGKPPIVILTRSVPYFSNVDLDYVFNNVIVKDAVVTVTSSDGVMERLSLVMTEESPIYYAYVGHNLGRENTDYTLNIEWNGHSYSAKTSILTPFTLDSIWFSTFTDVLSDTARSIRVVLSDNPNTTDYYQFFVKVHGVNLHDKSWISTIPVAFDDATFSGQSFNYELLRATPSSFLMPEMTEEEEREFYRMTYRPGDTVYIKSAIIDYDSYQFWKTGGSDIMMGQNPFLSPTPIISNIKGDNVLGVWCGSAVTITEMIYPLSK